MKHQDKMEPSLPPDASLANGWRRSRHGSILSLTASLTLLALWLWLFRPVYPYLAVIFTRQEFRTNQILLLGVLALLAFQVRKGSLGLPSDARPHASRPALILALIGSVLFVLAERFLDINTLSASLFGLASYGLLGLWMSPMRWRQGLPAALLLVGALPFGEHLQTFVGYPVRLATAAIVRDGLAAMGVHAIGVDTILVFENGISQVDLPCSGVQSLWTGGLFLLAATWIDRRPLNKRWLIVAIVFAVLLLAANLLRVGVLVTVGEVAGWRLLAEMLHVPLGVLGFAGACLGVVLLLRWAGGLEPAGEGAHDDLNSTATARPLQRPTWLAPALVGVVLALSLLYTPRPAIAGSGTLANWVFPPGLDTESWPLTPGELEWLGSGGALAGDRWRFSWSGHRGSMLFITSNSWRAHHRPERCFQVYGLTVSDSRSTLVAPDFPLRLLSLGAGPDREVYTAVYWFQSGEQVTDDYATRIWADLEPEPRTWVLVTILLDEPLDPLKSDLQTLYLALRLAVSRSLGGGDQP